jgi:hypothetical protein
MSASTWQRAKMKQGIVRFRTKHGRCCMSQMFVSCWDR